jgi:alpha-L-arabinofuranosidase
MKAEEWKIYQQRFPAVRERHIFLSIDEYAYTGNSFGAAPTLKQALAYAMVLQEMLRYTDFLTMAAFTTGASTMDVTPTAAVLNATGKVFELYGEHFGAGIIPVEVDGESPQPEPRYPVGFAHPKVRAGSPTYPLDVIAGLTRDRQHLRLAVVNATFDVQPLSIAMRGIRAHGPVTVWHLGNGKLDSANKVGAPPQVNIKESTIASFSGQLSVPPASVLIYDFPAVAAP